jgi:hypothetical protein
LLVFTHTDSSLTQSFVDGFTLHEHRHAVSRMGALLHSGHGRKQIQLADGGSISTKIQMERSSVVGFRQPNGGIQIGCFGRPAGCLDGLPLENHTAQHEDTPTVGQLVLLCHVGVRGSAGFLGVIRLKRTETQFACIVFPVGLYVRAWPTKRGGRREITGAWKSDDGARLVLDSRHPRVYVHGFISKQLFRCTQHNTPSGERSKKRPMCHRGDTTAETRLREQTLILRSSQLGRRFILSPL